MNEIGRLDQQELERAEAAVAEVEVTGEGGAILETSAGEIHDPNGIVRNDELGRYEISHDGLVVGVLWFEDGHGVRTFTRAEVEPMLQGQGFAGRLVEYALEETRREGYRIVPQCPYVADWIEKHPDYADLVAR